MLGIMVWGANGPRAPLLCTRPSLSPGPRGRWDTGVALPGEGPTRRSRKLPLETNRPPVCTSLGGGCQAVPEGSRQPRCLTRQCAEGSAWAGWQGPGISEVLWQAPSPGAGCMQVATC